MPLTNSPQLQLFALVQVVYGIASIFNLFDTCSILTGRSCSHPEIFLLSIIGNFLFVIGIGFFALTVIAYDDVPKKKRLAFVAMYCASAQIASAILAGRTPSGIMPAPMHIAEVSVQIALFLILSTALWGDVSLTGHGNPIGGGATKIFSAMYALFLLCWVYVNADALEYSDVFEASGKSSAYHFLSQAISVYAFEMFILFGFGAMHGTDDDNSMMTQLAIFHNVCLTLQLFWFEGVVTAKIMKISVIQTCVVAACGLLAICVDRRKRYNHYESIGGLVR
mmetsp:Transcript_10426/g.17251  ORF Transcript_10426/g.17251 Transcript_10426/m.17251 type:complete len:280 (-) Transcript_10426:167-1006(-)|eukprot:CAMPEP_0197717732 /NCGR_PEP_ID=MMETSP1434-20131217/2171_1 /TAXON_ID=265543 /ORGANISM="Minutocellus polymorphus, Strain CCMP3303" /LENGTH=279 /DNA_ID=CAMNT_0043302305 /DNA_START=112 /DNA_END=951 /DNA_ORIENTATION=-